MAPPIRLYMQGFLTALSKGGMAMKRIALVVGLALSLVLPVGAQAAQWTMKFGHDMPEDSAQHAAALKYADLVLSLIHI